MALGMDQAEGDVMKRKPRSPNEGVFARGLTWKIISRGFMIGAVTLVAFWLVYQEHDGDLKSPNDRLFNVSYGTAHTCF